MRTWGPGDRNNSGARQPREATASNPKGSLQMPKTWVHIKQNGSMLYSLFRSTEVAFGEVVVLSPGLWLDRITQWARA